VRPFFTAIVLWLVAIEMRWMTVDAAVVGSDSLGPYLQALSLSWSWLPKPPNPESGDALWYLALPLVHAADSVRALFHMRMAIGAVVAPAAFAAAWWFLPTHVGANRRWVAALTAGFLTATDPGLIDTLISGARSYAAPELIGLATASLALTLRGSRIAAVATAALLVMATDHHPLAAGFVLAALAFIRPVREALGARGVKMAAAAAVVVALPRIVRTTATALCGAGPLTCLAGVATSNVGEDEPIMAVLERALHDRFAVDLGWVWMVLLVGVAIALLRRAERRPALWAIGGVMGILVIGASIGYVRAYHLRIAAVPLAVAAAIGLSRWWPVGLVVLGLASIRGALDQPVGPDSRAALRADTIAIAVRQIEGPVWVDQIWWSGPPKVDAPAVVLSAVLSGDDPARFDTHRASTFVLLIAGDGPMPPGELLANGRGWAAVRMPNAEAASRWRIGTGQTPHQWGGAFDWMATIHPHRADMKNARW
jgi:hypothetical protein